MAVHEQTLAAASAVGTDHMPTGMISSNRPRLIQAVALVGSAAVNDMGVDLMVNQVRVARIYNSRAGANVVANRDDFKPVGILVPAGATLTAPVFDAGVTNQSILSIALVDL